jgi:hypothetical protein
MGSCHCPPTGTRHGVKNKKAYVPKEVFIISDADWRDVLSLVPVTVWTKNTGSTSNKKVRSYPTMVYHRETSGAFDADSIIRFLQQYKPDRVTIVENPPPELFDLIASHPSIVVGAGLHPSQVKIIGPNDFPSYWKFFKTVVYVDDTYPLASLASTYASLLNVPLVIKGGALDRPAVLANRRIICVGTSVSGGCAEQLDYQQLQRRYLNETMTPKIVLVNPDDFHLGLTGSFQPEKSGSPIATTFSNMSLAAPILASAKHQLLVPIPLDGETCGPLEGTDNSDFVTADDAIESLIETVFEPDIDPSYLTVVASPKAVQYWSDCGNPGRGAADWQYGSLDNLEPQLHVGRIYGITVSDASAYVARSLFYPDLVDSLYGEGLYTGLAIAAPNFGPDQTNAQEIKTKTSNAGYEAECFTWEGSVAQPLCDVYTNIQSQDYLNKQFISFADHGGPAVWSNTLGSADIPWLDVPYTFALACQTNNFWGGSSSTFGPTWIRRGGISYHASIPNTDGYDWELWSVQELTGPTRRSLGEIATDLIKRTDYNSEVKRQYILLGDPTLVPLSKEVVW